MNQFYDDKLLSVKAIQTAKKCLIFVKKYNLIFNKFFILVSIQHQHHYAMGLHEKVFAKTIKTMSMSLRWTSDARKIIFSVRMALKKQPRFSVLFSGRAWRFNVCKNFATQKLPIRPIEKTFDEAKSTCESRGSQITTIATLAHYWDHLLPLIVSQVWFSEEF